MRNPAPTIACISADRFAKNIFTMICARYGSSASEKLNDFMEEFSKVHYIDFMEDPIFAAAGRVHSPEREWDAFVMELEKTQKAYLADKSINHPFCRQGSTPKIRDQQMNDTMTIMDQYED